MDVTVTSGVTFASTYRLYIPYTAILPPASHLLIFFSIRVMAEVLAESDPRLIEPRYFLELFTSFFLQRSTSCVTSQSISFLVDFSDLMI